MAGLARKTELPLAKVWTKRLRVSDRMFPPYFFGGVPSQESKRAEAAAER
jgi:hypothetical protein